MKFVQFENSDRPGEIRLGYMEGDDVVDINKHDCTMPATMLQFLKSGCICSLNRLCSTKPPIEPKSKIKLMAPITGMDKVLCVGQNYIDCCKELNIEPPSVLPVFSKFASCIIGPNEPIRIRTQHSKEVDWEVELVVVNGNKCSNVTAADANKFICGYTIAQDISSRDWQKNNGGHFLLGKAQDTFCPIGPWIVTSNDITDPHSLNIKCSINGVEKQSSNTSQLICKVGNIIERVSKVMTLLPGDIILTGTPAGVGTLRKPPQYLKPGDVVLSEIEQIGSFEVIVAAF